MKYKILETEEEVKQVIALCEKHKINAPTSGIVIIAIEDHKVVGIIGIKKVAMIEPLISENPLVALGLYERAEGIMLEKGEKVARGYTSVANEKLFNKFGYKEVFQDEIILEKIL